MKSPIRFFEEGADLFRAFFVCHVQIDFCQYYAISQCKC